MTDTGVATAGFYRLEWRVPAFGNATDSLEYQLQESRDPQFRDLIAEYQVKDSATVMSGRSDGRRFYRLRALRNSRPVSQWSESVSVETRHHSLTRAFSFFTVGATVFVLTLLLVLLGGRNYSSSNGATGN
ncbi:MAG: hypothetical protein RQ736_14070 [Thiogranum sp.]|nr:hypothetical protein [Thiogranum sp.]